MRNQISFTQPPQDLFLNPAKEVGMSLLRPADFVWRPVEPALIQGFAVSAHAEINHKIQAYLTVMDRHKAFSKAIELSPMSMMNL